MGILLVIISITEFLLACFCCTCWVHVVSFTVVFCCPQDICTLTVNSPHIKVTGHLPWAKMSAMRRSVSEAFWAMCAADSMSMPVHWYYDINDIRRDFGGWISGFNSPPERHPSSILTLSNTGKKSLERCFWPALFVMTSRGRLLQEV